MKILALALVLLAANTFAADYGKIEQFEKGKTLTFPDLTLTYLGERKVTTPKFPPGFTYYDFQATRGSESKTISWTSGTGVIDWTDFKLDGKNYVLELRRSRAAKGWLKDNQLVLWPLSTFEKTKQKQ